MLIAGIDEAGRGAVIGPLVVAGVSIREEDLSQLIELRVKDSKLLSPGKREVLAPEIRKVVQDCVVIRLMPCEIDDVVNRTRKLHGLNRLEAQTMAKIMERLRPEKAYVDASDVLEDRFKKHILECLKFRITIISEHKADRSYPIVSAASIVAKVDRDHEISRLASRFGDFGSGYPSDPKTMSFLKKCLRDTDQYPDFVRKSWKPARRTRNEKGSRQTTLD